MQDSDGIWRSTRKDIDAYHKNKVRRQHKEFNAAEPEGSIKLLALRPKPSDLDGCTGHIGL